MSKRAQLNMRLRDHDEHQQIHEAAKARGLPVSHYIRALIQLDLREQVGEQVHPQRSTKT
jgi:predicted DNA binding CopG/RHH family protein